MHSILVCVSVICVIVLLSSVAQSAISKPRMVISGSNSDTYHQNAERYLESNIDEQNNTIVQL